MPVLKIYLIRAVYDWSVEQGLTPYLLVDAGVPGTEVPAAFVKNNRIVLNLHPRAVTGFELTDPGIVCSGRFGGRAHRLAVPMDAIRAIYAKENGQGISFPEKGGDPVAGPLDPAPNPPGRKGPTLKIIK